MNNKHSEQKTRESKRSKSRVWRAVLFCLGCTSVILGVIGIFLPLLPTTPFLLLAAACFLRSSDRFYLWLINHPRLSQFIVGYIDGSGVPRKAKLYTLVVLWSSMGVSIYLVPLFWVKVSLPIIALLVSIYIWNQPEPTVFK